MSAEVFEHGVRGVFYTLEDAGAAVVALEAEGIPAADITLFSPIPTPELEEHLDRPVSKVRWMTLIGGLLGCLTGLTLTLWTFYAWPHQVGGKSTASLPVTVVIMFELTVLLGGLFTLASVFIFSRIPALTSKPGYHPRFSDDLFGVYVHGADGGRQGRARDVLDRLGAEEVEHAAE